MQNQLMYVHTCMSSYFSAANRISVCTTTTRTSLYGIQFTIVILKTETAAGLGATIGSLVVVMVEVIAAVVVVVVSSSSS